MMDISFIQLIPSLIVGAIFAIPLWRILPRTGVPAWISLLILIPLLGIFVLMILLWVMAFKTWPREDLSERFE